INGELTQSFYLLFQNDRIENDTVSDDVEDLRSKNPGRNLMKHMFDTVKFQGMASVGTALKAGHYLVLRCQDINNFSFSFISPLEAQQYVHLHFDVQSNRLSNVF